MMALWRVVAPSGPQRVAGGGTTVKWTTILSFAALSMEAAGDPTFGSRLTTAEARQAALHGCLSEQGYPNWMEPLAECRPDVVAPIVRDALAAEWSNELGTASYFLYQYSQPSASIPPEIQAVLYEVMTTAEPKSLQILDRGLTIGRNLIAKPDWKRGLHNLALTRFNRHKTSRPDWATRYLALLFATSVAEAANALLSWLRETKPSRRRPLAIKVIGSLFGHHDPLVTIALDDAPAPTLAQLLLFAYQEVPPEDDVLHEGVYSPGARDHAQDGRNVLLKALLEKTGRAAYEDMLRLAKRRDMRSRAIRFRELARGMAERDAEIPAWRAEDILRFEREHILPVKTGADLYRLAQAVLAEVGWDFENENASSRAVLETAKDENAVQNWLDEQLRLRAKDRFHVSREPEVAEGNVPDIVMSAASAPVEVAIEVKHGGKKWSTQTLESALRNQLAEDYLRPANRRHGIFVVTNHRRRGWTHPHSGQRFTFSEMITYLNEVAARITSNAAGEIAVAVVGIDALPRPRRRGSPG
jgi:hypothetical protein